MSDEENLEDIDEEMIDEVMNVISTDGYYQQAEIVKITCPVCGEEFLGTKRHAGGFIAGHRAYHEFVNSQDMIIDNMGGI
jgi:hypothetical protein